MLKILRKICAFTLVISFSGLAIADEIHFWDGRVVEVSSYKQEGDQLFFKLEGNDKQFVVGMEHVQEIRKSGAPAPPQPRTVRTPRTLTTSPPASTVEFESIRNNMKHMTSVAWDDYSNSLIGKRVEWTGWVSDVKEQLLGGYKILIDMDPPGSLSVFDVKIDDLPKDKVAQFARNQKIRFSGKIKSVTDVLGSCAITLEDVSMRPAH
jgi:hypothetical protein